MNRYLTYNSRLSAFFLILGAASALTACDDGDAHCGASPEVPIVGFIITTQTGDDPTNADIYFCYQTKSNSATDCLILDNPLNDDFEVDEVNTFEWQLASAISAGDFKRFYIKNEGDDILGIFADTSWELVRLQVEAQIDNGDPVLLYDESMSVDLDEDDSYCSSQCSY